MSRSVWRFGVLAPDAPLFVVFVFPTGLLAAMLSYLGRFALERWKRMRLVILLFGIESSEIYYLWLILVLDGTQCGSASSAVLLHIAISCQRAV